FTSFPKRTEPWTQISGPSPLYQLLLKIKTNHLAFSCLIPFF
ncbi:unnamed protein product, partial [Gulo gulo]